jgi:hypothetical protein
MREVKGAKRVARKRAAVVAARQPALLATVGALAAAAAAAPLPPMAPLHAYEGLEQQPHNEEEGQTSSGSGSGNSSISGSSRAVEEKVIDEEKEIVAGPSGGVGGMRQEEDMASQVSLRATAPGMV